MQANKRVENATSTGKYHCGRNNERGQEKNNKQNTAVENAASTGKKRCKTDEKATGELQKEEEEY